MIKYLGSKRKLMGAILETVKSLPDVRHVLDLFSGTSRVGHGLKSQGYQVTANDHTAYAHVLAQCYVAADRDAVAEEVRRVLEHLNGVVPEEGYFTETFCRQSRYVHPKNGARVDAMRTEIDRLDLRSDVRAVVLVSLMEATDRVDSTCGLQMAYLKQWAARANNDLQLRMPDVLPGTGRAWNLDALEAAQGTPSEGKLWDLVYLDPPYNQHKYMNNYHVWESLIRWDKPEVYGTACKRVDCKDYRSAFNSKPRIHQALSDVVQALSKRARYLLVSFSSEGHLTEEQLVELLSGVGSVRTDSVDYPRYVGAQIGIYNPDGNRVGRVGHLTNKEHLFLVQVE